MKAYQVVIFDLDGVIVDTAKYHYRAWKQLAYRLGFEFTEEDNERLKGVSRMDSLEILLEIGNQQELFTESEKEEMAAEKNGRYVESLESLSPSDILPGVLDTIVCLKDKGSRIALGSASKNAVRILTQLDILHLFDEIVDGNCVEKAKPDPEVFLIAAEKTGVRPENCLVFEDAYAGIEAAKRAGMDVIGIGTRRVLANAPRVVSDLRELEV
ncbi:beta-phosphoglucomutase [Gottschalkiaceae bacterium SANA]|nr:beta-phosphoglucomutase [Gottschalkiaceae bacterium SANA]